MSDTAAPPPSANDFDPDLPSNRMIFEIRRDNAVWPHFLERIEDLMNQYGLGEAEKDAFRRVDVRRLGELGVHPYFLPQVTRLFHGAAGNTTRSAAALAYRKSFGEQIVEHRADRSEMMAEFVSIMAMAHAPGVTGWIESCPPADQDAIQGGYEELGRIMRDARPDVIIGSATTISLTCR